VAEKKIEASDDGCAVFLVILIIAICVGILTEAVWGWLTFGCCIFGDYLITKICHARANC
jgi:hypothetical protein